ncbi:MAG: ABC transporter ATP-binding protein [Planctomycetota bacterium]
MGAVEIRNLTKCYGRVTAVDGVSLDIEEGAIFGLLGPNGSGKTTTLSCALGLLRPTSGEVRILGERWGRMHRTRGRVGVVFDAPILIKGLSVLQNLEYAAHVRGHAGGRSLTEALELVDMAQLAGRPAGKLSLGQSKRMAIAAALAGKPELLVLDEPLSGLDPLGVRQVLGLVQRLAGEGLTIVLSSHRLHEMQRVLTHAAILLDGKLARAGTLAELLGSGTRHRLHVDATERARVVIEAQGGTRIIETPAAGELVADLGRHTASEINRALVQAGVGVSGLEPASTTLQDLFESLVDAAEAVA